MNRADKYKDKILAVRNYKSDKKEFGVEDFLDWKTLERVLEEIMNGESDITPAGKTFLQQYYGLDQLAQKLVDGETFLRHTGLKSQSDVKKWFEELVPMEITAFILAAKGNHVDPTKLRSDLMPPEDDDEN